MGFSILALPAHKALGQWAGPSRDWRKKGGSVASRPRVGGYSQARTPQLVWASWRETQLGRNQQDRYSWTGTSYSHETGSRPTEFSFVYKYLLVPSRIDNNKQCFHNQYMHACLLRATYLMACTSQACISW